MSKASEWADEARLAEIRARVERATPAPWSLYEIEGRRDFRFAVQSDAYTAEQPGVCGDHSKAWPLTLDDGEFIAHAREDIPFLLAALAEERSGGALWFFAVSVFETEPHPGGKEYYAGGWTHDGPYKTREECEAGRRRAEAFTTELFKRRQVAGPCVRLTFEEYISETGKISFPAAARPTDGGET